MKYKVLKIAVIAGAVHALGEIIELPEDEAKGYLDNEFIKAADEEVSAETEAQAKTEAEAQAEAEKETKATKGK